MSYQKELSFLRATFAKSRAHTELIDPYFFKKTSKEKEIFDNSDALRELLPTLLPETLYCFTDSFEQSYRLLLLPDAETPTALCIGPFLTEPISEKKLWKIAEKNGISLQKHSSRYLSEYYGGLPILSENNPLTLMLHVFCEKIWNTPSFLIKDVSKKHADGAPFSKSMLNIEPSEALIGKKAIEQRYAFENEMIRAVTLGQPHVEDRFRAAFSLDFFEKRNADPLRNAKNYGIIMNTLLRKAAEKGGVHPVYIDQTSSEFASRLERLSSPSAISSLMSEMFRTYCRLVRKHALRKFSLVVQKTMLIIDADLSADLSPKLLASSQGISLGYLSTVFRKETKKTLSEYIRERRIEYAQYLLSTTELQIQTIALHCGVMDAQYFSKQFKQTVGVTPMQYRRASIIT